MSYAKGTSVSIQKTEAEIKATLRRYKATSTAFAEGEGQALVMFEMEGRRITFRLPLPRREDFAQVHRGGAGMQPRTPEQREKAWEQACSERWRSLFLCIKAKLESVETGIETFEDAFLAHIQLPNGQTVSEMARPAIASMYENQTMQPLLPAPGGST